MYILRRFRKNISLRAVNMVGLSVVFACLLLSVGYIKRELSYDHYNSKIDRIVRMSEQFNEEPVDGRIYGNDLNAVLQQMPEIERKAKMLGTTQSAVLTYEGNNHIVNNFYLVNSEFFHLFDIPLLQGEKDEVLRRSGQMVISESFARQLFDDIGDGDFQKSEITIKGWHVNDTVFVSGVFKDIPETSHFHADILLYLPDEYETLNYTYLLLKENTDIKALEQKITDRINEETSFQQEKIRILLTPLADIHLHSHNLREMSINGNMHYIYLVIGANVLLLIVVLANLWLNASLIFAGSRRYYQLLRLHGASSAEVFKDETFLALLLGGFSVVAGTLAAFYLLSLGKIPAQITWVELGVLCPTFLLSVVIISLLPALKGIAYTLFLNTDTDLRPIRFSYSNVKYMLTAQYAVVMIVVILAFGINKQMNLVKDTQVGGNKHNILILSGQPEPVKEKYTLLKSELLKHSEIESVTACFQLPGEAIRDGVRIKRENETDWIHLPVIIAGEDFLSFFHIPMIAGRGFSPEKYDYQTEQTMLLNLIYDKTPTEDVEEYVINRKALALLGFNTPEEAIGQMFQINHGFIDYICRGIIVGVTDDFNYTGLYEETIPLLILQRNIFLHCIMVRLDSTRFQQAQTVFEKVWNEIHPDYPANYTFMNDTFGRMYHNEINAQQLVYVFSLLCIAIADLGLIIFMAFIIRRRTKEIGIRKVFGASVNEIIRMLNIGFVRYIILAFVIAVPVAWYVMHRWLQHFAYRTSLDWWIFILAGLTVLLISVASVSLQSWRAAKADPVKAIGMIE